ncbi:MAG: hypothetical protein ABSD28_12095 [Tepidisphaeraceae bacterium]|jgi:hypothetical protein
MIVRFHIDPESGLPHCETHGVWPEEVLDVLRGPSDQGPGREGTRIAEGQARQGRYLRVVFKHNDDGSILVITAYDLSGKSRAAYRRRRRRKL